VRNNTAITTKRKLESDSEESSHEEDQRNYKKPGHKKYNFYLKFYYNLSIYRLYSYDLRTNPVLKNAMHLVDNPPKIQYNPATLNDI